jgi:protein-S-isoprenylcysteine O-methyltransferase Ste14
MCLNIRMVTQLTTARDRSKVPAQDAPGVVALPPLVYALGLAAGLGLEALLPSATILEEVRWPAGGVLLATGMLLGPWFLVTFWRAGTPVDVGKPTTALVTHGPFRLSRNPGYLSLALIYLGIAVLASALWALATLVPTLAVIQIGVIQREERYLERKFGEEYRRYKSRIRQWL